MLFAYLQRTFDVNSVKSNAFSSTLCLKCHRFFIYFKNSFTNSLEFYKLKENSKNEQENSLHIRMSKLFKDKPEIAPV